MSIVSSFTRDQWYANGEWAGVELYVDGVVLLFREEEDQDQAILPVVVRIDSDTGKPWPEDDKELPDVPFRYYSRDDENPKRWFLEDEGVDKKANHRLIVRREKAVTNEKQKA